MKFITPKSLAGRTAVWLGIILLISMILSIVFAALVGGSSDVIDNSVFLKVLASILSVIFTLSAPLSFVVGMYAIIKYKEWPVWKPLAVFYFLTLALFLLGEFLSPH